MFKQPEHGENRALFRFRGRVFNLRLPPFAFYVTDEPCLGRIQSC